MSFYDDPTGPMIPISQSAPPMNLLGQPVQSQRKPRYLLLISILVFVSLLALVSGTLVYLISMNGQPGRPLSTPTARATTSAVTATPASSVNNGTLSLDYQDGNQNINTNQIQLALKLTNTGTTEVALADVTIRYWYTADSAQTQEFVCDYATIDCENVHDKIVQMQPAFPKADSYLEISFSSVKLAAGANTEIKIRVHKSDWSNYSQNNDYSFMPGANNYSPGQQIGIYQQGKLISGNAPA